MQLSSVQYVENLLNVDNPKNLNTPVPIMYFPCLCNGSIPLMPGKLWNRPVLTTHFLGWVLHPALKP